MAAHLVVFSLLTILEAYAMVKSALDTGTDFFEGNTKLISLVYNIFNFLATNLIIYLFWAFSRGLWIKKLIQVADSQVNQND